MPREESREAAEKAHLRRLQAESFKDIMKLRELASKAQRESSEYKHKSEIYETKSMEETHKAITCREESHKLLEECDMLRKLIEDLKRFLEHPDKIEDPGSLPSVSIKTGVSGFFYRMKLRSYKKYLLGTDPIKKDRARRELMLLIQRENQNISKLTNRSRTLEEKASRHTRKASEHKERAAKFLEESVRYQRESEEITNRADRLQASIAHEIK